MGLLSLANGIATAVDVSKCFPRMHRSPSPRQVLSPPARQVAPIPIPPRVRYLLPARQVPFPPPPPPLLLIRGLLSQSRVSARTPYPDPARQGNILLSRIPSRFLHPLLPHVRYPLRAIPPPTRQVPPIPCVRHPLVRGLLSR